MADVDIAATPKLLGAAFLGATLVTHLPRQTPRGDTVMLKLEWVQSGGKKGSESVTLRALLDRPTTLTQTNRTIRVTPIYGETGQGDYTVVLNVSGIDRGAPTTLDTQVRARDGETVVVMGQTSKQGRTSDEKLLFLTVNGL